MTSKLASTVQVAEGQDLEQGATNNPCEVAGASDTAIEGNRPQAVTPGGYREKGGNGPTA